MKQYILLLSSVFPFTHRRKGEHTYFEDKISNAGVKVLFDNWCSELIPEREYPQTKIHTIRSNYPLWKKRFEQIELGNAYLSIRCWTGKPYHSKMREIARLTKDDGIGLQMLEYKLVPSLDVRYGRQTHAIVRNTIICDNCLAENDGLSYDDWLEWLRPYNTTEPLAIIHLTRFRY